MGRIIIYVTFTTTPAGAGTEEVEGARGQRWSRQSRQDWAWRWSLSVVSQSLGKQGGDHQDHDNVQGQTEQGLATPKDQSERGPRAHHDPDWTWR